MRQKSSEEKQVGTIDLTPSWTVVVQIAIGVIENPRASHESVQWAKSELLRLAKWQDDRVAKAKAEEKASV